MQKKIACRIDGQIKNESKEAAHDKMEGWLEKEVHKGKMQKKIACRIDGQVKNESKEATHDKTEEHSAGKMVGSDENFPGVMRPSNLQGGLRPGVGGKLGQNRRALSTVNRNVIGAPPLVPCAVNKRNVITDYSNKANAVNKIPPVPIHRPITRKLAAQIASKQQQPAVEVIKPPPVPVAPNRNESEDCIIIDAEDYKATGYSAVPMFVQHIEAMMEEIDRMDEEIEMEDAEDWSIVDIDSSDKKNSLSVVEYITTSMLTTRRLRLLAASLQTIWNNNLILMRG
ncbi:cyclin-B2-4-like isoform X2 [Lycium barbarum]|uniref:cyclin-B2-4-like isoform X2 n=1 Tax=Lycium barbarum TaxID=112863 RepID=UPI00293EAF10|nr:cyclin-B2-4-like isoform X2 [Lycium barbarum]